MPMARPNRPQCQDRAGFIALALVALAVTVLLTACGRSGVEQAPDQLKSAQVYRHKGQFKAALIEAQNAIRAAPEQMAPHLQLVSLYNQLGYFRSAVEAAAMAPDESDPALVLEKARALNGLRKYRSARDLLLSSNTVLDDRQQLYFHLYLGQALAGLGELDRARSTLQKAADEPIRDRALVELARISLLEGNSRAALATLEPMLDPTKPLNAEAHLLEADIAIQRGKYERAEGILTGLLGLLPETDIMLPERIEALQLMARALTLHGRTDEAARYQQTLAEQLPEYAANKKLMERSIKLIESGRLYEASEILKQVLDNSGDSFAGTLLGIVSYMQGNLSEAATMLMANIDPETANSAALELLLSAKFQLNEIDQVLEILEPELQTRGNNPILLGLYGLARLARQDLAGIADIEKSLEMQPKNNRLRLALLTFYQRQGLLPQALDQARTAYSIDPLDPAAREALVQLLLRSNKIEETLALAEEIASSSPGESHAQQLAGVAYLMAGNPAQAAEHLQRAIEIAPDNASAWMALAELAYNQREYRRAENYFNHVLDIVPGSIGALKGCISSTEAQGDVSRGLQKLQQLSDDDPASGVALAVTAQYQLRNQQAEAAANLIEEALQRQPGNRYIDSVALEVYQQLAAESLAANDLALARKQLSRGLAQLPNATSLLELLAKTEMRDGNPVAANEAADLLIQIAPAIGYQLLGDLYSPTDHDRALAAYLDAWNIQVSSAVAGRIYRQLKVSDPKRARAFLKDWATQIPGDSALMLVKAIEAQESPEPQAAIALYQQLLEAEPDNVAALNNLAWLYLDTGDDTAKALELAQMAQQLSPGNPAILDTLGMVYLARGDAERGIQWLEKALQLEPESTVIQGHLNQALAR